jgi:eukaryotic-like serine/threonine-protein kinase
MDPAEQAIYLGLTLGARYRVDAHIGDGNFSGVFRATDQQTGHEVAVKILTIRSTHSPEARIEFDGEKGLLGMLADASHVVTMLGHGTHPLELRAAPGESTVTIDVPYLVLELADASLAELLLQRHRLPWDVRLKLFRDLVKGVHQMHLRDMVHRDVKSENSLVHSSPQCAKIADLGRAKHTVGPPRFLAEAYVAGRGDLRFAPPELLWLCGSEDPAEMARVDLFLLGSLLYETATGVGVTSIAFTDPLRVHAEAGELPPAARKADLAGRLGQLTQQMMSAYDLFALELPPYLREPALALVRQLTHPDPLKRLPGYRQRRIDPWDLQWLLKKVDVLIALDAHHAGRAQRITRKRRRPTSARTTTRATR